jgi:hypothetical protein
VKPKYGLSPGKIVYLYVPPVFSRILPHVSLYYYVTSQYKLDGPFLYRRGGTITQLSIVTRLWAGRSGVQFPAGTKEILPPKPTDRPWGHPAPCSIAIGVPSLRSKRPERQVDHASLSGGEVKNEWSCTSALPAWFHDVEKENLKIYFALLWKFMSLYMIFYSVYPFRRMSSNYTLLSWCEINCKIMYFIKSEFFYQLMHYLLDI